MKRSPLGITLLVIGTVLMALAPVWKWAAGPSIIKVPDDLDIKSVYEGKLTSYFDPEGMSFYPESSEVTVRLGIKRIYRGVPERSSPSVSVIHETVEARDARSGRLVLSSDRYFTLDRKTSRNITYRRSGTAVDEFPSRKGYSVMLPMGSGKTAYPIWDDDTNRTGEVEFSEEGSLDGGKYKRVTVYYYKGSGDKEEMVVSPFGLPDELPARTVKKMPGNLDLLIPDDSMLKVRYFKQTDATIGVEPRTGAIVDVPEYREVYYADMVPGGGPSYLRLAELEYKQTAESVRSSVADAAGYFGLLDLVSLWLPLMFLAGGLIFFLGGLAIGLRTVGRE